MDVDAGLRYVGTVGWIQNINCLIYAMTVLPAAWHMTGVTFTMAPPEWSYCKPPEGFTANETVPGWEYGQGDSTTNSTDRCHLYTVENGTVMQDTTTCDAWIYETTQGETSAVTDLNLVCDRDFLVRTLQSSIPLGILVGSYIIGQISDTFGRRPAVLVSIVGIVVAGTAMSFVWNFELLFVCGFVLGVFLPGILIVRYVRMIEMYTPNQRLYSHTFSAMPWCVGLLLVGPLAYLLPDWRHFQLVATLPIILLLPLVWYSNESVRWLVQKGRVKEAEDILKRIAKSKNINYPGTFEQPVDLEVVDPPASKTTKESGPSLGDTNGVDILPNGDEQGKRDGGEHDAKPKEYTILDLFKTRTLAFRTMVVCYCWLTSNFVYYGFTLNIINLAGNKYLNFFLLSLTEIPSFIADFFIILKFGRRRPLIVAYQLCALGCILTAFIPKKTASGSDLTILVVVVAMIGKFFATSAFDVTYLVTVEVFPTVLRNIGTGAASLFGRVGGIIAPFAVYLSVIHSSIPLLVFGATSLVGGLLVLTLPETHNKPLPETIEEGNKLGRE